MCSGAFAQLPVLFFARDLNLLTLSPFTFRPEQPRNQHRINTSTPTFALIARSISYGDDCRRGDAQHKKERGVRGQ